MRLCTAAMRLVLPTLPIPAPAIGQASAIIGDAKHPVRALMLRLTQLFNLTGPSGDLAAVRIDSGGPPMRASTGRCTRRHRSAPLRRLSHRAAAGVTLVTADLKVRTTSDRYTRQRRIAALRRRRRRNVRGTGRRRNVRRRYGFDVRRRLVDRIRRTRDVGARGLFDHAPRQCNIRSTLVIVRVRPRVVSNGERAPAVERRTVGSFRRPAQPHASTRARCSVRPRRTAFGSRTPSGRPQSDRRSARWPRGRRARRPARSAQGRAS